MALFNGRQVHRSMGLPHDAFEGLWQAAETTEVRAGLLDKYFPSAASRLTPYQRSVLMLVDLPRRTRSINPKAQLAFCGATIRVRECEFRYCMQDTHPDSDGSWICSQCWTYPGGFADHEECLWRDFLIVLRTITPFRTKSLNKSKRT